MSFNYDLVVELSGHNLLGTFHEFVLEKFLENIISSLVIFN